MDRTNAPIDICLIFNHRKKRRKQMTTTTDCIVAITGTLGTMSTESAIRHIHEAGCSYVQDINAGATCLVVGKSPDAKIMAKAAQLKIFVVWEDQFLERLVSPRCRSQSEFGR